MRANGFGAGRKIIIGAAVAGSLCGGAFAQEAQTSTDAGSTMIGAWEFSNADHDKICRFNFRADTAAGGNKLEIDKNCPSYFPSTRDIAGWSVDGYGTLRLLDARGNAVIELTEAETGIFDGFAPGEGRYVLQSAAAARMRSAEDMAGEWAVARGTGKPICLLTLANNPAGTDSLALKVKPGCDALVTRFAPTSWRMNQGELVLLSARGQTWRFEENDANTWQRVPEGPDPILLVRQ
ncbi:MAG TPA: AprI/Inh family metalloprotease inhibitor [Xanthobacteraceae bacterium]|nr:AprI/Inh family metalloprotease inhibitor [Xanthobacteraceae bacterium]